MEGENEERYRVQCEEVINYLIEKAMDASSFRLMLLANGETGGPGNHLKYSHSA